MSSFPLIENALKVIFNVEAGLSEMDAISIYVRDIEICNKAESIKVELKKAFEDETVSWREMPLNESYEVYDAESEDEAKAFVRRILWDPLQGKV